MRAGRLRHTVSIEKTTETQDSFGAVLNTWSDHAADIRAAIEPLNGKEYFSQDSRNAEITSRIRIRYLAGVTAKMRIRFGTRYFDIKSVINDKERNKELILMVSEDV